MILPGYGDRPGAAAAGQLAAIGCLGLIVAAVALQGFLVGIGGPIVGIAVVMAIALFVIGLAAYANRGGRAHGSGRPSRPARPPLTGKPVRGRPGARPLHSGHGPDQREGRVVHRVRHPRDEPPRGRRRRGQPRPGLPRLPGPAGAQGGGRGRALRRRQPVRDHLGREAAPRGDRREDGSLPTRAGSPTPRPRSPSPAARPRG